MAVCGPAWGLIWGSNDQERDLKYWTMVIDSFFYLEYLVQSRGAAIKNH